MKEKHSEKNHQVSAATVKFGEGVMMVVLMMVTEGPSGEGGRVFHTY
jgi:hypothetical protein